MYWKPLESGSIRLLHIEPASYPDAPISCSLQYVSLKADKPQYITLSYAWGETHSDGSHLTDWIRCDECILPVTAHLNTALKRIRQKLDDGTFTQHHTIDAERSAQSNSSIPRLRPSFWIDAICINQVDVQERNDQVRSMADIFSKSSRMLIWLGDMSAYGEIVRDFLAAHPDSPVEYWRPLWSPEDLHDDEAEALTAILTNPWFGRRWILQEVYRTQKVRQDFLVGTVLLESTAVAELARCYIYDSRREQHTDQTLKARIDVKEPITRLLLQDGSRGDTHILTLLNMFDQNECADARDRIYALLNMYQSYSSISINYSLSVENVYLDFAKEMVSLGHGLQLLYSAGIRCDNVALHRSRLPTWVPDWRMPLKLHSSLERHRDARTATAFTVVLPGDTLLLYGWLVHQCKHWHQPSPTYCAGCELTESINSRGSRWLNKHGYTWTFDQVVDPQGQRWLSGTSNRFVCFPPSSEYAFEIVLSLVEPDRVGIPIYRLVAGWSRDERDDLYSRYIRREQLRNGTESAPEIFLV